MMIFEEENIQFEKWIVGRGFTIPLFYVDPLLFPTPLVPSFLNFVQPPISCASILQPLALSAALFNLLILRIYTCQAFAA